MKYNNAGISIVDVSGDLAEKTKQAVEVPLIGAGGIEDFRFADEAVNHGRIDLVALGRALLAHPDWVLNARVALDQRTD